jgi:deazaflavin-dependent oxidoreductase (nitroreductase family)
LRVLNIVNISCRAVLNINGFIVNKEVKIMEIEQKERPEGLRKFYSRIPLYMYRLGLSKPLESDILVLTTKGRKSGKDVSTPLGYIEHNGHFYIPSLYSKSGWLANAKKEPQVRLQIGKRKISAIAEIVEDPEERGEAYLAKVKTLKENYAKNHYYVKPGSSDEEIKAIGESFPAMKFRPVD